MGLDRVVVTELEAIVGAQHVRTSAGDLEPFARDATPLFRALPDAVVWPRTAEEVAAILRLATRRGIPVVPRGAGSNLCAATVATRGGIVAVLTRMNTILEISPDELLARVEPGVSTAALSAAAAELGLLYAPDPGSRTVSTVGGNVATCAGGLRGLKYGVTRNYVLGTTAVLPTGEIIRTGGRLWKDVAGYDLTRLLTGSEGTLGVLTEITVALLPMPATTNTGVAYFGSLADAGRAVAAVIGDGIVPATLEFLDAKCIGAVEEYANLGLRLDAGALLLFGDDGAADAVDRTLARIGELCTTNGSVEVTLAEDVARSEALLAARRCSLPALSRLGTLTILEDATVPRPRLAEMVGRIDEIADRYHLLIATFGHAGDGNLHPTCVVDRHDDAAIERTHKAFEDIFAAAIAMDGTITGEHGVGAAKLPFLEARTAPTRWPCCAGSRPPSTGRDPQPRKAGLVNIFDPELLDHCISCGFCLPACPTYALTSEASFCLGCRACEPVCPAGVQYGQLLETWRDHQWRGRHRPPLAQLLMLVAARTPLLRMLGLVRRAARTRHAATGETSLMLGCFERGLYPRVSRAVRTLLPGIAVPENQSCCGALHAHNGRSEQGTAMARRLGEQLPGIIVTTAGGCAAHLAHVLGRDRVHELSEHMVQTGVTPTGEVRVYGRRARVTLQDSCHLRNGLGVHAQPRALIAAVADYVPIPGAGACCGAAGTYSLLRPRDARLVLDPRLDAIEAAGVDYVVAVNPGCLRQLETGLRHRRSRVRAVHLADLLAAAARSPGPQAADAHGQVS